MLSFRSFLTEIAVRDQPRAERLLDYIHGQQVRKNLVPKDVPTSLGPQMANIARKVDKRPVVSWQDFDYSGQVRDVPVHSVVSGQGAVSKEVIRQKLSGQWNNHIPEMPYMIHHQGTHYVVDGNHRVSVARLRGAKTMTAKVIDAPEDTEWHHY